MSRRVNELQPSWRRTAGVLGIVGFIALWTLAVVSFAEWIGPLPPVASIAYFTVAGIVWILPLRPLLMWMETGKWRE